MASRLLKTHELSIARWQTIAAVATGVCTVVVAIVNTFTAKSQQSPVSSQPSLGAVTRDELNVLRTEAIRIARVEAAREARLVVREELLRNAEASLERERFQLEKEKESITRSRATITSEAVEFENRPERAARKIESYNSTGRSIDVPTSTFTRNVTTVTPHSSMGLYSNAVNDFFRGNYRNVVQSLDEAIRTHAGDARFYYFRGLAQFHLGNKQAAVSDFELGGVAERQRDIKVSRSLERIQGESRGLLEKFRPR